MLNPQLSWRTDVFCRGCPPRFSPLHDSRTNVAQEPWCGHACIGLSRNIRLYSSSVSMPLSARCTVCPCQQGAQYAPSARCTVCPCQQGEHPRGRPTPLAPSRLTVSFSKWPQSHLHKERKYSDIQRGIFYTINCVISTGWSYLQNILYWKHVNFCTKVNLYTSVRCIREFSEYISVLLAQYCSGDKIEKNEMGGACSAYGGEERRIQGFGGETWRNETTWKTQE